MCLWLVVLSCDSVSFVVDVESAEELHEGIWFVVEFAVDIEQPVFASKTNNKPV